MLSGSASVELRLVANVAGRGVLLRHPSILLRTSSCTYVQDATDQVRRANCDIKRDRRAEYSTRKAW